MKSKVKVILVGIGGYGHYYVNGFVKPKTVSYDLVAAVDPVIHRAPEMASLQTLRQMGVELFEDLDVCLKKHTPDVAILATPIAFHCPQVCKLMKMGINVLCEKPIAGTVQEAYQMLEAEKQSTAFVGIGFQWSFSRTLQAIKKDIMDGRFGKAIRLKTLTLWPRPATYYKRSWAAKLKDAQGNWILDSPVANATAHYLHNCLFVLGETLDRAAQPRSIVSELYRGNKIENYDAAGLRVMTQNGVEIIFLTAHTTKTLKGPMLEYEFEKGTITYEDKGVFKAKFKDGTTKEYGVSDPDPHQKMWDVFEAALHGNRPVCGLETALPHLICVNGAQDSMPEIVTAPSSQIKQEILKGQDGKDDVLTYIEGLDKAWMDAFEKGCLPSELGYLDWAKKGREIDLTNYRSYPGGK